MRKLSILLRVRFPSAALKNLVNTRFFCTLLSKSNQEGNQSKNTKGESCTYDVFFNLVKKEAPLPCGFKIEKCKMKASEFLIKIRGYFFINLTNIQFSNRKHTALPLFHKFSLEKRISPCYNLVAKKNYKPVER